MLASVLGIACLLAQGLGLVFNLRKGTILSIVLILIAPNIFNFAYELPGTFLLIFAWVLFKGNEFLQRKITINDFLVVLIIFLVAIVSVIGSVIYSVSINLIGILGYVRMLLALVVFRQIFTNDGLRELIKVLNIVIIINFIVSCIQMTVNTSVNIFYAMYWRPSITPLGVMVENGAFSRAFGTFATPLYLGALVLLAFPIYYYKWLTEERSSRWFVLTVITIITGLLCMSKTTYLGIALCGIVEFILVIATKRQKHLVSKTLILILGVALLIGILIYKAQTDPAIRYYLSYFKNPLKIFESRYGDEGNLVPLKQIIRDNFLFGVGLSPISGEFIGDSAYFTVMHDIGFVGLLCYLIPVIVALGKALWRGDAICFMLALMMLLQGLGFNIFTNIIGMIYYGFILAVSEKKNTRRNIQVDKNITLCKQYGFGRN